MIKIRALTWRRISKVEKDIKCNKQIHSEYSLSQKPAHNGTSIIFIFDGPNENNFQLLMGHLS